MGRKPTMENEEKTGRVYRTFRFCEKTNDMLDLYSEQFGKYKYFVVETALTEYLDKNVEVEKVKENNCNHEKVKRSYIIDIEIDNRLNKYCLMNGVTKSLVLEKALEQYLKKHL